MACKEPSLSTKILSCFGLFLFASSFCLCTELTKLKAPENSLGNSTLGHVQLERSELHHGRLLIRGNTRKVSGVHRARTFKNLLNNDTDYQADMGWEESKQTKGQDRGLSKQKQDNAAVERLLQMEPKVECTRDSMKLQVQDAASTPGSLLFVDRGSRLSPLPLSKLPPSCGYSIKSTRRDLVLVAPYDGCFVAHEEDAYVLPLRWWGLPVRMSCPLMRQSSSNPPVVTCQAEGMIVKTEWTVSAAKIKVKLSGDWEPLMTASSTCGFGVVTHPEGVVISVPYTPCLLKTDGLYSLELAGDGEIKISCPPLPPAGQESTKYPVKPPVTPKPPHPSPDHLGQVYQPFPPYQYPFYPQPEPEKKPAPAAPQAPQPEAPKGQNNQQSYLWPGMEKTPDKPTTVIKPKQPEVPQGQEHQQFHLFPYYLQSPIQPENPPTAMASHPPEPEAPKNQVHQQFPPHPQPEKSPSAPKLVEPESPEGQIYQSYYQPLFYYQQEPKNPTAEKPAGTAEPPQPPQRETTQSQEHMSIYPYPFYTQPGSKNEPVQPPHLGSPKGTGDQPVPPLPGSEKLPSEKPAAAQKPSLPDSSAGQIYQPFYPYHYPFYPQPGSNNPPAANLPETPELEAPKDQVQQPEPQKPLTEKPTSPSEPQPATPHSQESRPFYPYHYPYAYPYAFPFYSQPENQHTAIQKPTAPESKLPKPNHQSSKTESTGTNGDTQTVKIPQLSPDPQFVTLPPVTPGKQPQQPSKGGTDTQDSQSGPPYKPPVYCPQSCPSGMSQCCVQIAFHQHLHHILPAKETPPLYPGLPFLPSMYYSGLDQDLVASPLPQKSTGATSKASPAPVSAPVSAQSTSSKKTVQQYHQPPDGSLDAIKGSNPSMLTNQQPIHIAPNPLHSYWTHLPQQEGPQSQLPAHHSLLSQSQVLGTGQVNPGVQYPTTTEHRPSVSQSSGSKVQRHQKVTNDLNRKRLLHHLLHKAHNSYNNHSHSSQPQPSVSNLQDSNHQPMSTTSSEPMSYVLLQHGPPGRVSNSFNRSPLPSTDHIHDANYRNHKPQYPQNLTPPREEFQQPEWLNQGLSNPLPGSFNYKPRFGDGSSASQLIPAPVGPHFVPQEPSFSSDQIEPAFPDFWKPMTPLSSSPRTSHILPEAFHPWSPAADQPANGFIQPIQEGGEEQE